MSFKSNLLRSSILKGVVKLGIKLTPKKLVSGVANIILKGIVDISKIAFDLNKRTAFVEMTLYGEEESIQISLEGFEILGEEDEYQFILHNAHSNKPWMTNLLARISGKAWDIPPVPQYKDEVGFVAALLKPKDAKLTEDSELKSVA